jgi:primosomal protein N' (replication factor Y)
MARVILRSLDEKLVAAESKRIVQAIREIIKEKGIPVRVLGPAPAPITRLRKYYRYHFQMTSEEIATIQELWRHCVPLLKVASDVELTIDVDPVDLR